MTLKKSNGVRDDQQPIRPGEAFKLDAERAAHRAARAVGADQIAAGALLGLAVALDGDTHARAILAHGFDGAAERDLEVGMAAHLLVQNARELGLLALHPVGMLGRIGDGGEVELRQQPLLLGAILERRRLQPLRQERLGGAERMQHVERRRMEGRGPQFLAERRALLEHRDRDAGARQMRGGNEADRPGAGDENPLFTQREASCLSMILSENRFPLFGIMLYSICAMPALVMMSRYLAISA